MAIRAAFPVLAQAFEVLDLGDVDGVQIVQARCFADLHHPPLNPDVPAFILGENEVTLATLQRVLLNQYALAHEIAVCWHEGEKLVARRYTLAALAEHGPDWALVYVSPLAQPGSFERFQEIIAHLRAPEGCPWDRKQTHRSLRPYLLEETYEVLAALDADDPDALREELGDLLLQIVLHSQVAVDAGTFRMSDIIAAIHAKIIHRHPHVWGDVEVHGAEDVKTNWDRLKQAEKAESGAPASRLDGVSPTLPALSQAYSYQDRAARVKFDWETIEPVIAKVHEEIAELLAARTPQEREEELGDLLFAVVNWARWLGIDPESALRATNARFYRRFRYIEEQVAGQNRALNTLSPDEMDALWEAAKRRGL